MKLSYAGAMLGYAGALVGGLIVAPQLAAAAPDTALENAVFVERIGPEQTRNLVPARRLTRGDRLIYLTSWKRNGAGGFVLTYPLPRDVAYESSANADEEISADGGRTWGRLGSLRTGGRLVVADDVTHVRWRVAPVVAARGSGRIAWSAIVR